MKSWGTGLVLVAAVMLAAVPARAIERFRMTIFDTSDTVRRAVRAASLLDAANEAGTRDAQEIFAAARADYENILGALYGQARYGATISILLDGREASEIPLTSVPATIRSVQVRVDAGPRYRFGSVAIAPLAPGFSLPDTFAPGAEAGTAEISAARDAALRGWFEAGRALAETTSERFVADHARATLDARMRIEPGPLTYFGAMRQVGQSDVRAERIEEIAGFPTGKLITPEEEEQVIDRLRRTGTFSSVLLTRGDDLQPGSRLNYDLEVIDQQPRRLGFGIELSSTDGLALSGMWMHRNLLGGAENLRIDGEVAGIGGLTGGTDYSVGVRLTRPATLSPNNDAFAFAETTFVEEPDYEATSLALGIGLTRRFSDTLTGEASLRFVVSEEEDDLGMSTYRFIGLPISIAREGRDDTLDPTRGTYFEAEFEPYLGLKGTENGLRFAGDARAYYPLGERFVVAGRAQLGTVFGPDLDEIPNRFRLYSGGGGTVRGQDYQSLGVDLGGGVESGGKSFAAIAAELRTKVTDNISVVGFYDMGFVSEDSLFSGTGQSHAGAGLGLRYNTGIGPIRFDLAVPVDGPGTPADFYAYIGIGQAF